MPDKTCETCAFRDTPPTTTVCQTCTAGGVPNAPHWKATQPMQAAEYGIKRPGRIEIIGQNGNDGLHYQGDPSFVAAFDQAVELHKRVGQIIATKSDGSTASYYELPEGARELQDLISYRGMNAQVGEIFRACYRYGLASHSDRLRDAKKMKFYAEAEIARLEKYGG